MPRYWLDSNVLIAAHRGSFPHEVVPTFWTRISEQVHSGAIVAPKMVFDEITELSGREDAVSRSYSVLVWVYSLMTNHIHTIVVPSNERSLAETFRGVHSVYGQWFNRKYGLSGHLWQGRYYSCALDDTHLWAAVRYVERNPVRAKIVERAEDYRWSSARAHVFGEVDPLLDPGLPLVGRIANWTEWLAAQDLPEQLKAIRTSTARDLPLGSESFISDLEKKFGRPLRPGKRGPKERNNDVDEQQPRLLFGE